jgi:hypothetical protein
MQPERPECQCLACAQLQHQQANDTLLLVTIGTVLVVGGLVWLTGQLAGLLASGSWPHVPLSELPGILVRLRDHAGDPAAAWPASVRNLLPGPLRACASRRSWAAAGAVVPAIVGPGAADEPTTDDGGSSQRQPELDHPPAPLGAPAQLAVLVGPGMGPLDHPATASLDRRWQPAGGDLAHHPALGQDLPAWLVVVAGVQVHQGSGGERPDQADGVQGRGQQPIVALVGRGRQGGQRDAARLDGDRAF